MKTENKNKEFVLSKKMIKATKIEGKSMGIIGNNIKIFAEKDIKEFIKLLKEEINKEQGEGELCDNCIEKIQDIIDKLVDLELI